MGGGLFPHQSKCNIQESKRGGTCTCIHRYFQVIKHGEYKKLEEDRLFSFLSYFPSFSGEVFIPITGGGGMHGRVFLPYKLFTSSRWRCLRGRKWTENIVCVTLRGGLVAIRFQDRSGSEATLTSGD
ncbi:hypothetical protein CEXT_737531 [Caerostris extrusa]|uniref:Uncharacterized protein n=1 Tax=Caerostris extrusa TaxID=172846 RepID=A0AAV4P6M5_CAEEX|nr:hypothetical protein CEXT_737531 [Caerostris extrusa]